MNRVVLIGRLGSDPELRYTQEGTPVCKLSIATDRRVKDGAAKETDWHSVVAWTELGQNCAKYLSKGRQVAVEGEIQYRNWTDKNGTTHKATEIVARNVEFLGDGKPAQTQQQQAGGNNSW